MEISRKNNLIELKKYDSSYFHEHHFVIVSNFNIICIYKQLNIDTHDNK